MDTSGVDSILYVIVHDSITSLALCFTIIILFGNFAASALHFDTDRFHTTSGVSTLSPAIPSDNNRAAIPSPIIPRPINPIAADIVILVSVRLLGKIILKLLRLKNDDGKV